MLRDFRDFIARGNVIDLAVAVVIGAAFGKIVDSLVKDIIMPPIGLILGRVDFSNLYVPLDGRHYPSLAEAQKAAAPTINYGLFLNHLISFIVVAFAVFIMIRQFNRLRPPAAPSVPQKECRFCRMSIPSPAIRCPHCTSELQTA